MGKIVHLITPPVDILQSCLIEAALEDTHNIQAIQGTRRMGVVADVLPVCGRSKTIVYTNLMRQQQNTTIPCLSAPQQKPPSPGYCRMA